MRLHVDTEEQGHLGLIHVCSLSYSKKYVPGTQTLKPPLLRLPWLLPAPPCTPPCVPPSSAPAGTLPSSSAARGSQHTPGSASPTPSRQQQRGLLHPGTTTNTDMATSAYKTVGCSSAPNSGIGLPSKPPTPHLPATSSAVCSGQHTGTTGGSSPTCVHVVVAAVQHMPLSWHGHVKGQSASAWGSAQSAGVTAVPNQQKAFIAHTF